MQSLGRRKPVPVVAIRSSIGLRSWCDGSMAVSDVYLGGCALDRPVSGVMIARLYM